MNDKSINDLLNLLESDAGEEITKAAKILSDRSKEVADLSKDQLKNTLQLLLESIEKPNVDDGEVYHTLLSITNEMISKYEITVPEEQSISYDWFVKWLEENR
jgi:hypothetical protein